MRLCQRTWRYSAILAIAVLTPPPRLLGQQAVATISPAQVLDSFLLALHAHRWAQAGQWLNPDGLQRIRRRYLNEPSQWTAPRPMTAEDYMRGQPDMPREVAEYFARRAAARPTTQFPYIIEFGLDSITQLSRMNPKELAEAWVKAHDAGYRLLHQMEAAGCVPPPQLDSALSLPTPQVLGVVVQDSITAYGLIRLDQPFVTLDYEQYVGRPSIAMLRRTVAGWRVQPFEDMLQTGGVGMGMVGCTPRKPG